MPTITFTARTVATLKPVPGSRVEYFDVALPGLAVRVSETGAKTWTFLYRHVGRPRRLTLGPASGRAALSLADARDRAKDAIEDVRAGKDPALQKKEARRAATIAELGNDYLERYAKRRKRSWREDDRMLRAYVLPAWKHRAVREVSRRDIRTLVDTIAERAPIQANRVLSLVSKMFKWALDEEIVDATPAARIPRPGVVKQRDRVLSEDEIRQLWRAFDALAPVMLAFYKLRLITVQPGKEVSS